MNQFWFLSLTFEPDYVIFEVPYTFLDLEQIFDSYHYHSVRTNKCSEDVLSSCIRFDSLQMVQLISLP